MPAIPFLILVFLSATSCIKREFNAKESKATKTTSTTEVKSGAPLDVNDVSILLPPPTTSEDADAYLWLEKDDLLPQPVFDDVVSLYASSASTLFDALKSDETKGTLIPARTAGLAFRDPAESSIFSASLERKHFYVAGVRFDFCAPGRHLVAAPSDCKLQVRLVAHPLWTNFSTDGSEMPANARRPSDDALHVVFEFGNTRSEREVFSKEVAELVAELKEQAAPPTGGEPLGIHPAFRTTSPKDSAWWTVTAKPKMLTLLRKGRLALVAANILGKETRGWGFVAGVVKNGRWIPVLQKYGKDGPEVAMQRQSVSVSPEFGLIEPVIPVNQRPSFGPILNVGAALTLAHHEGKTPPATSLPIREWDAIHSVVDTRTTGLLPVQQLDVRHVDCISCHRVNAYAFTALDIPSIVPMWAEELARIPSLVKTDLGTPFLTHEVIKNTNSWNTRAFGHHHELPSVSLRTLTESLEAAQHGNEILGRTSRVWKQCDVKAAWTCLLEAKPQCISTHCIPVAP